MQNKAKLEDDTLKAVTGGRDGTGENWGDLDDPEPAGNHLYRCRKCGRIYSLPAQPAVCPTDGCGGTAFQLLLG